MTQQAGAAMIDKNGAEQRVDAARDRLVELRSAVALGERVLGAERVLQAWVEARDRTSAGSAASETATEVFCAAWETFKEVSDGRRSGEMDATAGDEMRAWGTVEAGVKKLLASAFGCRFEETEMSSGIEARWVLELTDCDEELVAGIMLQVRSEEPQLSRPGRVVYVTVSDFGCDIGFDGALRPQPPGVTDAGARWLQDHTGVELSDLVQEAQDDLEGMEL